jgi:hypothetical protein
MVAIAPPAEDAVLLKRVQLVRVRVVLSRCKAPPSTACMHNGTMARVKVRFVKRQKYGFYMPKLQHQLSVHVCMFSK